MTKQYSAVIDMHDDKLGKTLSIKILGSSKQEVKNVQIMIMDILKVMPLSTPPNSDAQEGTQTTGED